MNNNANMKQFQLLKFINENCNEDHVITKISIALRRDKIEAPYYMITKIRMSSCIDRFDNGLIHAMDTLNHARQHNLTEGTYNEIKSLIVGGCNESDNVTISEEGEELNMVLMSKDDEEFIELFNMYHELFNRIDDLAD